MKKCAKFVESPPEFTVWDATLKTVYSICCEYWPHAAMALRMPKMTLLDILGFNAQPIKGDTLE